ncbi:RluA family pseudouridine synthase [Sporosarcina pasteurii]|uniref:Pseudouridine synthase n=1 Tax=Sporosarcina pasteurii TaxID=1474 RepID=A0A380BGA7_SPOPA|nr:RluA family pseudouridine synthase [Sporosarcina pasteurii]MDS9470515.1 RluA family pseudouridine synthase [Sporosarcina pasteurii]QBQ05789.1 RluA family pseudouridine synthase [Sporosarcina pasteurii]SUJ00550.1 Ribosomal large subunit pseudouridine synthase D [Sporosarcina pasteurii]
MEVNRIEIEEELAGTRLDRVITMNRPEISRTQIQQWIKDGNILVNDQAVKPNYRVRENDCIVIDEPEPEELNIIAEDLNLEIIYEDQDVLIVNKPRGMVVHPAKAHASGTLVNGLMYHCKDLSGINGVLRPGIVHRTDKDTSGLLMVAKNDIAHVSLVDQLVEKSVKRVYLALVHGHIPHNNGTIDAPIGRDEIDRQKMTVTERGKDAVTHFKIVERFKDYTLVECELETGRTHQIRVHMEYIGHPLVGDPKYGLKNTIPFGGQVLHAGTLGFTHPRTNEYVEFTVEPPEDFQTLLNEVRNSVDK